MNKFTISKSFAISAGAGSGKTYTLSRRYINAFLGFDLFGEELAKFKNRMKNRAEIDEIVTITYTNAAALEMKERIFSLMKKIVNEDKEILKDLEKLSEEKKEYVKERLKYGLTKINEAKISTIHSFAFDLIKKNSDFLKLNSNIEIIDEFEREKFFEEAYYKVVNGQKQLVLEIIDYLSLFKLKELAKKYVFDTKFRDYFDNFKNDLKFFKNLHKSFGDIINSEIVEKADQEINGLKEWYEDLINYSSKLSFKEFVENQIGESLNYKKKLHKEHYSNVRVFRDLLDEDYFYIDNEKEKKFEEIVEKLKELLKIIYKEYKNAISPNLDFDLVLQKFDELLNKKEIKFKYIMVDEFQDTNMFQYELIKKLKYDNLFLVGDEKQSIYSFQGGEIEVFKRAKDDIGFITMDTNYRSDEGIIKFVNDLFKELFKQKALPIENDFSATYEKLEANNKEGGKVEVLITKYEDKLPSDEKKQLEAKNIALLVKNILDGKKYPHLQNYIKQNQKTIGILYDSKADMVYLKEALNSLGIDCKVNGGDDFWDSEEIKDMIAFLKVIFEDDKFYIARVLESLGYSDKEILEYKDKKFEEIKCDELHTCIQKVYKRLFEKYQNPAQAQANVEKLISEVINLQNKYNYDKKKVLEVLEENFLNAEEQNAFFDSDNAGVVELCSIHYTKGLEYPLIILTSAHKDLANQGDKIFSFEKFNKDKFVFGTKVNDYSPLARRVASHISKLKHLEEKKRLLYVALTRAKHNIVLSFIENDVSKESYISWIMDVEKVWKSLKKIELNSEFTPTKLTQKVEFDIYEPIEFKQEKSFYDESAILGSCVHKILELHHENLSKENIDKVIFDFGLEEEKEKIYKMIENFKNSDVYKELQKADEKYFELPFVDEENGRIDLVYKLDNTWKIIDFKTGKKKDYTVQLEKYKKVFEKFFNEKVEAKLLYLGEEQ